MTWWTNSFWTGMLWLMHRETGKASYRKKAQRNEEALDECFTRYFQRLHHDVGFLWLLSAVANYRITGNEQSKMRGMRAACVLAGRYQIHGHFIRAWNGEEPGVSIIDTMMNLPLLYWASEVSGDPRFRYIAQEHTNTVLRSFVRSDGSVNHIVVFDTLTGEVKDTPGGQGYASGSSWSRGQAWALYGLALGYIHTKDEAYLEGAKRVAHYFLANIGPDGVPALDFRAPREPKYIDTTAGSIAASGLLEIEKLVPDGEKGVYRAGTERILQGLWSQCDFSVEEDSMLQNGSEAYHTVRHIPIIYGDYFLLEALMKIQGKGLLLW